MLQSELENVLQVPEIDFLPEKKKNHMTMKIILTPGVRHFRHGGIEPTTYAVDF